MSGGPTGNPPDGHPGGSPGEGVGQVEVTRGRVPGTGPRMGAGPYDGAGHPARGTGENDTVSGRPIPTHLAAGAE